MKFNMISEVFIDGVGKCTHRHVQDFEDDSNVFGRVLEYHQYMRKTFPNCEFKLIKAVEERG